VLDFARPCSRRYPRFRVLRAGWRNGPKWCEIPTRRLRIRAQVYTGEILHRWSTIDDRSEPLMHEDAGVIGSDCRRRKRLPLVKLGRSGLGSNLAASFAQALALQLLEFARKRTAPDRNGSRSEKSVRKKRQRERLSKRGCERSRTSTTRVDAIRPGDRSKRSFHYIAI